MSDCEMPGPSLRGNLVACGHVDHIDEEVHQRRAEGEGQVVAARLDQHHIPVGKAGLHLFDGGNVHRGVFAHGRMGAGAGLHADDALLDQHAPEHLAHVFGVFGGHNIIGDDQHFVAHLQQARGDGLDQGRFSGNRRARRFLSACIAHC